jgi:hypothetical protein
MQQVEQTPARWIGQRLEHLVYFGRTVLQWRMTGEVANTRRSRAALVAVADFRQNRSHDAPRVAPVL